MKWAGLIVVLAAIFPLAGWLRRNPGESPKIWILVGFLPFAIVPFHLFCAVISWMFWSGYVKGVEFTVLDAVAVAIYLSLPPARNPLPFRISLALYFVAVLCAVFQAEVRMAALFYVWQLARMFLVYAVVVRASADERVVPALLTGMALGLFMETGFALWERLSLGLLQTAGTFGHQNFLGMVSQIVIFPFFALLLRGRMGWLPAIVTISGAIIAVLTTSRATVGLDIVGCGVLFVLSALRRWTSRKAIIAFASVLIVAMLAPVAISAFEARFAKAPQIGDYDERGVMQDAAAMILSDHPMGIGPNSYVLIANVEGYNARAGVAWTSSSAFVHNAYWLVADETGYLGLVTFLILLLRPLTVALRCGWRNRLDYRGDLLLGFGVALLVVYIHSWFEWIFLTFQMQYMFALTVGAVAGLSQQLGYWRQTAVSRVTISAPAFSMQSREQVRQN